MNYSSYSLSTNETVKLKVNNVNSTFSWTSSNENIATVDDQGQVTAHKTGEVTITATDSDGNTYESVIKMEDKYVLYNNGTVNANNSLVDGSYNSSHYINFNSDDITYDSFTNSYLYASPKIDNNYSSLYVKLKASNKGYDWGAIRVGVRPITGSDGNSNYTSWFIPDDWYLIGLDGSGSTADTEYRTFKLDLSTLSNDIEDYYFYLHTAGMSFSITEIWFE